MSDRTRFSFFFGLEPKLFWETPLPWTLGSSGPRPVAGTLARRPHIPPFRAPLVSVILLGFLRGKENSVYEVLGSIHLRRFLENILTNSVSLLIPVAP